MATAGDEELMAAWVAGDERAFEALFRRYAGPVLGVMRRGWLDAATAEDLAQQTFLQLHRARHDYRPGTPLRPWLFTIARNVKRDHLRRVLRRDPVLDLEGHDPGRVDEGPARLEALEGIRPAVARLPATLRRVVELHAFQNQSFAQIAELLGISRSAAKVRAHRAYRALRARLEALRTPRGEACDRDEPGDVSVGGRP